jgi:hypothetical protein
MPRPVGRPRRCLLPPGPMQGSCPTIRSRIENCCGAGQPGCARSMPMCVPPVAGPVGDSPRCGRCDTGRIGAGRCDRTPGPGSPSVPR